MKHPKGIDWKNVAFIIGQREDATPKEWRGHAHIRSCGNCKTKAYVETDYPLDVPVLRNVCVSQFVTAVEQDPDSLLQYDMPTDLKVRLIDMAHNRYGSKAQTPD